MSNEKKTEKIMELAKKQKIDKVLKYASDKDAGLRAAAAKALSLIKTDESYNALVTLTHDRDLAVRKEAVTSLGELGMASAVTHIMYAMDSTDDPDFRAACLAAHEKLRNFE